MERFARLETFRRARAHRRSEMRRPLSERRAERAALAKAEMRACRSAKSARERRLDRVYDVAEILRFAKRMARSAMDTVRHDERRARILKQEVRYNVARRGMIRSVNGGASRSEPFDYFDHALEEARMTEELAGDSRKSADEARDFLRKAREAVSGARGALQRLRRDKNRFHKAEAASHLFWERHVEKMKEHRDTLKRVRETQPGIWQRSRIETYLALAKVNNLKTSLITSSLLTKIS